MRTLRFAAMLGLVLATPATAARDATGWRALAWPAHRPSIDGALGAARAVDATQGAYPDDHALARRLLDRASGARPAGQIAGDWQVRSIQVSGHGTFAYPWFRASIRRTRDGLRFEKTTGSQRRSGRLLPYGDGRTYVFLGGTTVNGEPQVPYSAPRAGGAPKENDSTGRLYRIGARELLLVLDADRGRYELYHLRR